MSTATLPAESEQNTGELDVLNCTEGHIHITFDKDDPAELAKAQKIIEDMFKRGYAVLVETPKGLRKVKKFNPKTNSYVIQEPDGKPKELPVKKTKATGIGPTAGG